MGRIRSSIAFLGSLYDIFVADWRRRKGASEPLIERSLIGHQKAIAALKALNKSRDPKVLTKGLPKEVEEQFRYPGESDRSFIILNGSMIEDKLETVLHRKFSGINKDERLRLFGFEGPLGTFSSKIKMGQALGLLTRNQAKRIDLVREARNTAAHVLTPITFDTPEIRAVVLCFLTEEQAEKARAEWDNWSFRTFYGAICLHIASHLWSKDPRILTVDEMFIAVDGLQRGEKGYLPFRLHTWLSK